MEINVNEDYGFYMEGLACPPLDDFAFFTTSMAADADHRPPIDVNFSGFFDELDDNGELIIKGSEEKTKQQQYGKGKQLNLLQTLKKPPPPPHGKGKEMRLLLASKDDHKTNPNEAATIFITNTTTAPAPSMSKNVRVAVTKPIITNKRALSTDPSSTSNTQFKKRAAPEDDEHKLQQTIKKIRHIYDKAAEAKRNRQVVVIDYVTPKQQPKPNRFKSKKLQKLFAAR